MAFAALRAAFLPQVIHQRIDRPALVAVGSWRFDSLRVVQNQQGCAVRVRSGGDVRQVERGAHEGEPVGAGFQRMQAGVESVAVGGVERSLYRTAIRSHANEPGSVAECPSCTR